MNKKYDRKPMTNDDFTKLCGDPSTSYWLRDAIRVCCNERDVIDALNDAETLVDVMRLKLVNIENMNHLSNLIDISKIINDDMRWPKTKDSGK